MARADAFVPTVASGLAAARDNTYDAILVDYDLDDAKGDMLVAALISYGFRGKLVAISSHSDGNDALVRAGAQVVCAKGKFRHIAELLER